MTDQLANVVIVTSRQGTRHVRTLGQLSIQQMREFELLMSQLKRDNHIKDFLITGCVHTTFDEVVSWASQFVPSQQLTREELGFTPEPLPEIEESICAGGDQ